MYHTTESTNIAKFWNKVIKIFFILRFKNGIWNDTSRNVFSKTKFVIYKPLATKLRKFGSYGRQCFWKMSFGRKLYTTNPARTKGAIILTWTWILTKLQQGMNYLTNILWYPTRNSWEVERLCLCTAGHGKLCKTQRIAHNSLYHHFIISLVQWMNFDFFFQNYKIKSKWISNL